MAGSVFGTVDKYTLLKDRPPGQALIDFASQVNVSAAETVGVQSLPEPCTTVDRDHLKQLLAGGAHPITCHTVVGEHLKQCCEEGDHPRTPECFYKAVPVIKKCPECWPHIETAIDWISQVPTFECDVVGIYKAVRKTGVPNFLAARIPLPHGLNIQAWRKAFATSEYQDTALLDFLEYGFPVDFNRQNPLECDGRNHQSAEANPRDVDHYINTETTCGAIVGPLPLPLFSKTWWLALGGLLGLYYNT